jgi:2-oxoglutarate ferredoxin oxidoreductase subunit alpha
MDDVPAPPASLSLALTGSGGAGSITAGSLLLQAAGRAGWYGLMTRSVGPQIRGGEAAALLRLASRPVDGHDDRFDLLLALDWRNVERFAAEIPLDGDSLVIADEEAGLLPEAIAASGAKAFMLPIAKMAKEVPGGRANVLAIGLVAGQAGLPEEAVASVVAEALGRKGVGGEDVAAAVRAGYEASAQLPPFSLPPRPDDADGARWRVTGNQAAGMGALRGGIRYVAMYPITPATDMLEWMSPQIARLGGHLMQAEDEIAALNMVAGASYAGVPSLTATSGPGLALMTETLGLAVAAEIPMVVVNVMRGGPSTGIPTKSEQSDLNIALYGLHGDAPHLVLAPNSVGDCLRTTQWAVQLAERLQAPAIVLSDQFLGQAQAITDRPEPMAANGGRKLAETPLPGYRRYALEEGGISPMALPGQPHGQHTADGLEHGELGRPSTIAEDHARQLDKRADKLAQADYGDAWADIEGDGELAVITWGSATAPAREAVRRAAARGRAVRLVALRLLMPAQAERLDAALAGVERLLVVEQSHSAQFLGYLKAHYRLPALVRSFARPGPLPLRPGEIDRALSDWS